MPKTYNTVAKIQKSEYERVNEILKITQDINTLAPNEYIRLGIKPNAYEGVYCVTFEDGSTLNFDLCSDDNTYYDDVVWTSADNQIDVMLKSEFKLSDIEVEIESNIYRVKIQVI